MSDIMRPIPFGEMMNWIQTEYEESKSIFGISKIPVYNNVKASPIFEEKIESPFGPAAGPNTQLAQNIIASYLTGARFFEMKTVQIMDGEELSACVSKPCILASDECYNCEWSTELKVEEAYEEYVKAWFACKLLAKELGIGDPNAFVFNMSVGYDLEGIKSKKIDTYIEGMKDASKSAIWNECVEWAKANINSFKKIDIAYIESISSQISKSITLSTLHGCPPAEIERIATYLITEKKVHTYIKCNPTLLGYDYARKRLDSLGFDYVTFDDHHFLEDLQWEDAVPMFNRLISLCIEKSLDFGVKITNTFPVDVTQNELPSEEMYMSGRSLFPLSLHLAKRLAVEFEGKLRISYSGGADVRNIQDLIGAGIWPITMATTLLKPGGYERMSQIANLLMEQKISLSKDVIAKKVIEIDENVPNTDLYKKPIKPLPNRKDSNKVPLIDCYIAPCQTGCPIHQDIPAYLSAVDRGDHEEALKIITTKNPLPFITGTICPHHCGDKCMRNYYDCAVSIREKKLQAAELAYSNLYKDITTAEPSVNKKIAIVGGGPAGIAAAYFLSKNGGDVTVFEKRESLGGIVKHVIPEFRISEDKIQNDINLCMAYGAEFVTGKTVESIKELLDSGYTHIILAVGAWGKGVDVLKKGNTLDVIEFLEGNKKGSTVNLGENVIVIGGGNTAMDAARAAKRAPGVKNVSIVYRRTKRYMPADTEELEMAMEDGVEFRELLEPVEHKDGVLLCNIMELGAPDASGRRSPKTTGKTCEVPASTVIAAVGQTIEDELFKQCNVAMENSKPVTNNDYQIANNIYTIGDSRRGPATVVEGIADAIKVAEAIMGINVKEYEELNSKTDVKQIEAARGNIRHLCSAEERSACLGCGTVCETCVEVCPNRANVSIVVEGKKQTQVVHIDGMCNECGNCAVFCPYDSSPYKEKFTYYWSEEDFINSENQGFVFMGNNAKVRLGDVINTYEVDDAKCGLDEDLRKVIVTMRDKYSYININK